MIAEHRVDVIIKAGDFSAFPKERVVDLFPMSNVSASMVILNTLPPDLKAYVEDPFENTTGLDLSSLLARMQQLLYLIFCNPSLPIVLSNSGSLSSSSFQDRHTFGRLVAPCHTL